MAYYEASVFCGDTESSFVVQSTFIFSSSVTSTVDPCLFTTTGPCNASYFAGAFVQDVGWSQTSSGGGTGETVEVTSVAILVDGTWRQAVGQQLSADGLWHAQ